MIKERKGNLALRVCDVCGHEQWVSYWNLYKKEKHLCRYCNNKLTAQPRKGKPSWNTGKKMEPKQIGSYYINSGGYVETWIGKHTLDERSSGYYREHRLQAELKLGRKLEDWERVHHIDADKTNNIDNNLYVCTDDKHHQNVHSQLERISIDLVKLGAIKFNHELGSYYLDPYVREFVSKSLELLGNPEKDNQQRSLRELSPEERSTTIQRWSTLKRVEAGDNSSSKMLS